MIGEFLKGVGRAHLSNYVHTKAFNTSMFGTFNIKVKDIDFNIRKYKPCRVNKENSYWLVHLTNGKKSVYAFAHRWDGSGQSRRILELVSKRLIPNEFKTGELVFEVLSRWTDGEIQAWAKDQYWFQSFSWAPQRADSQAVFDAIEGSGVRFSESRVLDVGCQDGFFCFEASKRGAVVFGMDTNKDSVRKARFINDRIEMQDVEFSTEIPSGTFDYVFYLSVHHQHDAGYGTLPEKIAHLRSLATKAVFIELIRPPMFGANMDIDNVVGGKILKTYKHKVRGIRTIYRVDV